MKTYNEEIERIQWLLRCVGAGSCIGENIGGYVLVVIKKSNVHIYTENCMGGNNFSKFIPEIKNKISEALK